MVKPLFRDDAYLSSCGAEITRVDAASIYLDQSVFYPMGGGQAGDTGIISLGGGLTITIIDTRKSPNADDIAHIVAPTDLARLAALAPGEQVTASIDWPRRFRLMRLHTCMHLLCAVVPAPVTGGSITPARAHLDFDTEMDKLKKEHIEEALNALIRASHRVEARWISDAELEAQPELVRTMSVKPPIGTGQVRLLDIAGVDLQPCGGTHVSDTAQIGTVEVSRIRSEGKRNKRVTIGFVE